MDTVRHRGTGTETDRLTVQRRVLVSLSSHGRIARQLYINNVLRKSVLETILAGYRLVTSEDSLTERIGSRTGYLALRGIEAGISIIGVCVIGLALPTLVAESTPAPAGVGIMLLLMAVGLGILVTSFIRSAAELFVYRNPA